MKTIGIIILVALAILLLLALIRALASDNIRYTSWYEKHADWFGIIVCVLFFATVILFG